MKLQSKGKSYNVLFDEKDKHLISQYKWRIRRPADKYGNYYVQGYKIGDTKKILYMHRILMSAEKGQIIDHINGNGLDNRTENLRFTTLLVNSINRRKITKASSIYRGVSKAKDKWVATIGIGGKKIRLGRFKTQENAAIKYNEWALMMWGCFANFNAI